MSVLMGTVFIASLLGSLHCVGMCGPFALLAGASPETKKRSVLPTIAYSGGRLVTYTIVGVVFGCLGMALNIGGSFNHWQQAATYVAGALMVAVGLIAIARYIGVQIKLPKLFSPFQKWLGGRFAKARQLPPVSRAFVIGALTSLMPCGWLYTFALTAAGTGSPIWGAVLMIAFWAGTVPIMAALMLGADKIGKPVQKRLPVLMAGLVIAIGLFTIFFRAPVAVAGDAVEVKPKQELVESVSNIDHQALPCCSDK